MTTKKKAVQAAESTGVGGVALIASILGNLKLYANKGDKENFRNTVEALNRVVLDWQAAYQSLEAQLALILATNQEQNDLIVSLRDELRRVQARANQAEARALAADASALFQPGAGASDLDA